MKEIPVDIEFRAIKKGWEKQDSLKMIDELQTPKHKINHKQIPTPNSQFLRSVK